MSNKSTASKTVQQHYNTRKRKLSQEEESKVDEAKAEENQAEQPSQQPNTRRAKPSQDEKPASNDKQIDEENATSKPASKSPYNTRKRKRSQDSEIKVVDEDEDGKKKPEPSVSKKRKAETEGEAQKEKLKRLSKNECICAPLDRKPDYSQDQDAKITVEEWRLQSVQSPIELKHEDSNEYDHFEPLEFHGHWDQEGDATLTNNGYTATLTFQNREVPVLMGGPLHEDKFIFEQLHFHWSGDDHTGCEHIFEGKAYSMEAHAVHYNGKYGTFKDAADKHDGLAVVAFFLQATDDFENECFKKMSEAVKDIVKINASTNLRSDCLTWIKNEAQCKGYYTYQGSLTTEPYFESVTWIIYPKPIHISKGQVQNFRNMKSTPCEKHNIVKNVRPIQTPSKKMDLIYARAHKTRE